MKKLIYHFGSLWCLIVHDFFLDKHKIYKIGEPEKCTVCGRFWKL